MTSKTKQQKLEALIQKAIEGKWDKPKQGYKVWEPVSSLEPLVVLYEDYDTQIQYNYQAVIFDHAFVKSLFGEDQLIVIFEDGEKRNITRDIRIPDGDQVTMFEKKIIYLGSTQGWMSHLQQAVINEDPITYLYNAVKALEGEKK